MTYLKCMICEFFEFNFRVPFSIGLAWRFGFEMFGASCNVLDRRVRQ